MCADFVFPSLPDPDPLPDQSPFPFDGLVGDFSQSQSSGKCVSVYARKRVCLKCKYRWNDRSDAYMMY